MEKILKILHLEDLQSDADLINHELEKASMNFKNVVVDTKAEFESALQSFTPDIILADHSLTSFNSMEALKIVQEKHLEIPFLLVTTSVSDAFAGEILNQGAKGLILKDNLDTLPGAIRKALDDVYLQKEGYPVVEAFVPDQKVYNLSMLEQMDDDVYLAELLAIFLSETPQDLKLMHQAAKAFKAKEVAEQAHKLKSSAGIVEAVNLLSILKQTEKAAKEGKAAHLVNFTEAANEAYAQIEKPLKAHLKKLTGA